MIAVEAGHEKLLSVLCKHGAAFSRHAGRAQDESQPSRVVSRNYKFLIFSTEIKHNLSAYSYIPARPKRKPEKFIAAINGNKFAMSSRSNYAKNFWSLKKP